MEDFQVKYYDQLQNLPMSRITRIYKQYQKDPNHINILKKIKRACESYDRERQHAKEKYNTKQQVIDDYTPPPEIEEEETPPEINKKPVQPQYNNRPDIIIKAPPPEIKKEKAAYDYEDYDPNYQRYLNHLRKKKAEEQQERIYRQMKEKYDQEQREQERKEREEQDRIQAEDEEQARRDIEEMTRQEELNNLQQLVNEERRKKKKADADIENYKRMMDEQMNELEKHRKFEKHMNTEDNYQVSICYELDLDIDRIMNARDNKYREIERKLYGRPKCIKIQHGWTKTTVGRIIERAYRHYIESHRVKKTTTDEIIKSINKIRF